VNSITAKPAKIFPPYINYSQFKSLLFLFRNINFHAGIIFLCIFSSDLALAAPEEIEVYLDDFSEVGKFGLDLHTNYVSAGESPSVHQFRLTPELSYGVNSNWEVAGYFLTVTDPGNTPRTDGVKARARWRPSEPSENSPFYWAVNFEAGQVTNQINPNESTGEIKLIGVWRADPWVIGVNYNYDRSIADHSVQSATTEIDGKISYQIKPGLKIAWENYAVLGAIQNGLGQPQSNNSNYVVSDFDLGKWDFNVGIGHVSGQTTDNTVIKAIIGVPLN
jgi:hypothetical protein